MKLTAHFGKITWSIADKALYVLYGFVQIMQVNALSPEVYGVFGLLVGLNTWIMLISDGSALQGVIQFGTNESERGRANALGMSIHTIISLGSAALIYLLREPLAQIVDERFVEVAMLLPLYALLTIPRMFCLKLIYREMATKKLFWIDVVWFATRTALTIYMIVTDQFHTFYDIVLVDFIGMAASSVAATLATWKDLSFSWKGETTLFNYLRFGVPLAFATALNSTPRQLDVLIIAAFFGVGVVGIYTPAKNFFRFFEQAFDAATTLLYPAAVRMYTQNRMADLQLLVTKAISVTLIPTVIAIAILELGASNVIVWVLGEQYADAVGHFNVLIIGALGMPFLLMSSIITAMGHSTVVVRYSAIGLVFSLVTLFGVGYLGWEGAIGLGIAVNAIVVGILCTFYVRRTVDIPFSSLFRVFGDVRQAISGRANAS